jgi:hypothetical protein
MASSGCLASALRHFSRIVNYAGICIYLLGVFNMMALIERQKRNPFGGVDQFELMESRALCIALLFAGGMLMTWGIVARSIASSCLKKK